MKSRAGRASGKTKAIVWGERPFDCRRFQVRSPTFEAARTCLSHLSLRTSRFAKKRLAASLRTRLCRAKRSQFPADEIGGGCPPDRRLYKRCAAMAFEQTKPICVQLVSGKRVMENVAERAGRKTRPISVCDSWSQAPGRRDRQGGTGGAERAILSLERLRKCEKRLF
jgi:hypothetical protein